MIHEEVYNDFHKVIMLATNTYLTQHY